MARQRVRKRPIAEINVVPYIDVMLVMLVIFMITAPLLTQGVKVDLPAAAAQPIEEADKEPLVVTVDAGGSMYLNVGDAPETAIAAEGLVQTMAAVLRRQPRKTVLVRGDHAAEYGMVVSAMVLLQQAGVPNVGLVTDPPEQ